MHRQDEYIDLMISDGNLLGSAYAELGDQVIYNKTEATKE